MPNLFLADENKALVWGLLQEANAFINIPDAYFSRVTELYDTIVTEISKLGNKSIQERNKLVIVKMMEQLPFLKQFSSQKPLEEVKVEVDKNFKNKQEEFMQLVKHDVPKEVSFNEVADIPFDSVELNTRLNEMMANRNHDLVPTPKLSTNEPDSVDISDSAVPSPTIQIKELESSSPIPIPIPIPTSSISSDTEFNNIQQASHSGNCSDYIWSQFADEANKKVSFSTDRLLTKLKRVEPTNNNNNTEEQSNPTKAPLNNSEVQNTNFDGRIKAIEINQRNTLLNQDKILAMLTQILVKQSSTN